MVIASTASLGPIFGHEVVPLAQYPGSWLGGYSTEKNDRRANPPGTVKSQMRLGLRRARGGSGGL